MKKTLWLGIVVSITMLISGCGSNDFDTPDANSTVVDQNGTHVDDNGTSGGGTASSRFMNPQSIIVSAGNQEKTISVQVVDSDGVGVSGQAVGVKALERKYGLLSPSSVVTNEAGYAVFSYKAPSEISSINGTTEKVTFICKDVSGNKSTTYAYIAFNNQVVDPGTDLVKPIVVIPQDRRTITLHNNSQSEVIAIKVFKSGAPYSDGTVKVQLPTKVLNGVDVGLFSQYEVEPNAQGIATFNYMGPSNMADLIQQGDTGSTFKFYHSDNPTVQSEMEVKYTQPTDDNVTRNYSIGVSTDGNFSMGIPNMQKTFGIALKAKDGNGNDVGSSGETITKMTVETTNGTIAQIVDGANLVDSKVLDVNDYKGTFTLKSKKLSGLVPMKITIEFTDANGETYKASGGDHPALSTIINVRVFSGPPSAISISYAGTTQDASRAKYIEHFAVSVTDEYGHNYQSHPNIYLGVIVGYEVGVREAQPKETNETKRLFYGKSDIDDGRANGQIEQVGGNKAQFNALVQSKVFHYANSEGDNTDKLVVFGAGKQYEAMGKWDIESVSDATLGLDDNYYGETRDKLYYAVGRNYYQDQCRDDGREWLGNASASSYVVDDEGTVVVDYAYDYHLAGKDVLVWVNLDGLQPDTGNKTRIGEVVKHTLRTTGLTHTPLGGYSLDKGASGYATFVIWHENAPERYRNAHFGHAIKGGSTCAYSYVGGSNDFDARTCSNGYSSDGTSYVTYYIWASADEGCTFNIDRIMVSREF